MTFGQKLKTLRTGRNMTQDDLARELFVTRTAVSKWENDRGYPGIDSLKEISRFFGVSIDELISDEDAAKVRAETERRARATRYIAYAQFALAVLFVFLTAFVTKWCAIPTAVFTAGFAATALVSRSSSERTRSARPWAVLFSRIAIFLILAVATVTLFVQLF